MKASKPFALVPAGADGGVAAGDFVPAITTILPTLLKFKY
jgi:hypothetical protein